MDERQPIASGVMSLPISRRRLLVGGAFAGIAAFLAACQPGASPTPATTAGPSPTVGPSPTPAASPTPKVISGPLNFANWPAYIDLTEDGSSSPTLEAFKKQFSVEVNYQEKIEDNADFVATIRQQLQTGIPTGWDLIVLTDWMAAKLIAAGWIEKIDQDNVPNCVANLRDALRNIAYDPTNDYHYPWQSGGTGVGYNKKKTGRKLTKIADVFDPKFAGKVTMLTEMRDTMPLVGLYLQSQGKISDPPEQLSVADAQAIHDFVKPYVESGHIRAFTGNEYIADFASGDTWVAFVWSGDLASSGSANDVFVYPEEGSMIWSDNMLIPNGAQNKYTAEVYMNYVYQPDVAALLADYIFYISPVKGVEEQIKTIDPDAATNPLLFPPADVVAKQHAMRSLDEADETKFNDLFADLTGK